MLLYRKAIILSNEAEDIHFEVSVKKLEAVGGELRGC